MAGNITTPEITASLEYGVAVLGTKVLMVLGHGSCGAVKATIEGKAVPGQISALYAPIRPAVDAAGGDLDAAIDANAKIQATLLSEASPIIAGAVKEGKLKVVRPATTSRADKSRCWPRRSLCLRGRPGKGEYIARSQCR